MLRSVSCSRLSRSLEASLRHPSRCQEVRKRFFASWWAARKVVENEGSIARDIMAAERTFLAWARTGLGFCGAGSALAAAYHREQEPPGVGAQVLPASALLIGNGAFLLLFATRRYWKLLQALQEQKFIVDPMAALSAVAVTAASTTGSLWIVYKIESDRQGRKVE